MNHRVSLILWNRHLAVGFLGLLCIGCNPEPYPKRTTAPVTGTITYKGEPVTIGTITFQPASGAFTSAEIQSDGSYTCEAVIGPNTVMIVSREPEEEPNPDEPPMPRPPAKSYIPDEYGGPRSGLSVEVAEGDNTADFDLKEIATPGVQQ